MSGEPPKRDSQKTRQELLDEIYLLRDVAGERSARAERAEALLAEKESKLALVLASRSWRLTAPLRALTRWFSKRAPLDLASAAATYRAGSVDTASAATALPDVSKDAAPSAFMRSIVAAVRHQPVAARHLYVDVSELAVRQGKTGAQRVTREILRALLAAPPREYSVVPVVAQAGQPYRKLIDVVDDRSGTRDVIQVNPGDVFLGLDHAMQAVVANADVLAAMHARGARLWFVCNDTLPLDHPEWFPPEVSPLFRSWFAIVARIADGVACISRATETDVQRWSSVLQPTRPQPLATGVFRLGSDFADHATGALGATEQAALDALPRCPLFVMVGTIEPRKGHAQALEAFNALWNEGEDVALVIVGFPGWMTGVVQRRVRHHELFGKRLFWFMDASDALVAALYGKCTCLLAASEGEGFGLPLVEAARHGLPILYRDLPVFHEVASTRATYFSGLTPDALATAVGNWLDAYRRGQATASAGPAASTWVGSAGQLLDLILPGTRAIARPD